MNMYVLYCASGGRKLEFKFPFRLVTLTAQKIPYVPECVGVEVEGSRRSKGRWSTGFATAAP